MSSSITPTLWRVKAYWGSGFPSPVRHVRRLSDMESGVLLCVLVEYRMSVFKGLVELFLAFIRVIGRAFCTESAAEAVY